MKTYSVKFWYYTDLRCDWEGQAYNCLSALALAMAYHMVEDWPVDKGFKVTIDKV